MKLGFTGTRDGTTTAQHKALCEWLKQQHGVTEFHHGCCIGADSEAAECVVVWANMAKIIAHPPIRTKYLSLVSYHDAEERREPKHYLVRNRDIVDECDLLVACPKEMEDQCGGTWYTIRHARNVGRPLLVITPEGILTELNPAKAAH